MVVRLEGANLPLLGALPQRETALRALRDRFGDFAAGELDRLAAEGEESLKRDGPIPGDQVFKELRQRSASRRAKSA
jgi:hypothetical protein